MLELLKIMSISSRINTFSKTVLKKKKKEGIRRYF